MKALLLGYSSIAKRRVLPALLSSGIQPIDIASRSARFVDSSCGASVRLFHDYDDALRQSDAAFVYVSTVNSDHACWARKALERGFHVIVDKPAALSVAEVAALVDLAQKSGRLLAEANVFAYHPQIAIAKRSFEDTGGLPSHLLAVFSVPPLAPDNYRYQAALGGGALWDLGPYAVSVGRIFFDADPLEIIGRRVSETAQVETGFSFTAIYPGGRSCVGSFGYTTAYTNRLTVLGPRSAVTIDRVFSPPPDLPTQVLLQGVNAGQVTTIPVPPADSFRLFLEDCVRAITGNNHSSFLERTLADARNLDRLRQSIQSAAVG
jgi:predicted dehydrogenase